MEYSVSALTTVADCDLVSTMATKEKNELLFRKTALERKQTIYTENSVEVQAELTAVNAELAAEQTIIATLPSGTSKDKAVKRAKQLEYKQFLLTSRKVDYGAVALLNKELDTSLVDKQLLELDIFIEAITTRKAALS